MWAAFMGSPEMPPNIGNFLIIENSPSHWLLTIPPKPVDIWPSILSSGVTLPIQKSSPGWTSTELQVESFNWSPSWSPRKHLCSPSVNHNSLPLGLSSRLPKAALQSHLSVEVFRSGSNTNPFAPSTQRTHDKLSCNLPDLA